MCSEFCIPGIYDVHVIKRPRLFGGSMLLRQRRLLQRGGDDVIVWSRDHGGRRAYERRHWTADVNHSL